jgi:hypothetical protein
VADAKAAQMEARKKAEEERKRLAEEAAAKKAEQEAERREAAAKREQQALARKQAEEERKRLAAEAAEKKAAQEAERKRAIDEAAEARRAAQEAQALARQEADEKRKRAAEEARIKREQLAEERRLAQEKAREKSLAAVQKAGAQRDTEKTPQSSGPRPTFSLFGLGGAATVEPETSSPPVSSKTAPSSTAVKAPRGIPTISKWKLNNDNTISGLISGSSSFKDGEPVTTSVIVGKPSSNVIVTTKSGSR